MGSRFCYNSLEQPAAEAVVSWLYLPQAANHEKRRLPQFKQWSQSSPNEHISRVVFSTIAPHTPIEELARTLKHHVTEATWMQIESKHSGKAFVSHTETSLKFGISSNRWEIHWKLLHDSVPRALRLNL